MAAPLFEIGLKGDKKLFAALKHLSAKITGQVIRKATRDAQKLTLAAAKHSVPERTGKLKKFMKVRAIPKKYLARKFKLSTREARAVSGHAVMTSSGKRTDYPYYALFLEKGTRERGTYGRHWEIKKSGGLKRRRDREHVDASGKHTGDLRIYARRGRISIGKFAFLKNALFSGIAAKKNILVNAIKQAIAGMAVRKP